MTQTDWKKYIREHLPPMRLRAEREIEIVEELAEHLAAEYEEALAGGSTKDEARAMALALFSDWRLLECEISRAEHSMLESVEAQLRAHSGDAHRAKISRSQQGAIIMESLFRDVRYSFRVLLKSPGITLLAVLALALGIGLNTTVFSLINAVLLKPLPFDPGPVVALWEKLPSRGVDRNETAYANFLDWRAQNQSFEQMAIYTWWNANISGGDVPERVPGFLVSANLLDVINVKPAMGRGFHPDEDQPGKDGVVILSHGLWQRRFAGDPAIIGKQVSLNAVPRTVIGVLPAEMNFPRGAEVLAPLPMTPGLINNRSSHGNLTVARLKPGVSIQQAQNDLDAIAKRLEQQYPNSNTGRGVGVYPVLADTVREFKAASLVMMCAVGFVLLIACANVANLMLARASGRTKEIAVRLALGAKRWRIVQQLLTESVLLGVIGGTLGVLLAIWGLSVFKAALPADAALMMPGYYKLGVNRDVLLFTLIVSVTSGILFGLAPALQASKPDLNETLKEGGGKSSASSGRNRLRNLLVITEIALSLILLIGAGLMMKSFLLLLKSDPGFNAENVLTMSLTLPRAKYGEDAQKTGFYQELVRRVTSVPGVESAALVNYLPLGGSNSSDSYLVEGFAPPPPGQEWDARYRTCTPDYFKAMGITIIKGRSFTEQDSSQAPRVIIINETLARKFWPNGDTLGKHIRLNGALERNPWMEVVGVIKDVKFEMNKPVVPEFYLPAVQDPWSTMVLAARTRTEPIAVASAIRQEVQAIDKDLPVYDVNTMKQVQSRSMMHYTFSSALFGLFGALALALAAVGIYGVMSYNVGQRTHEIGVRVALGAQSRDVTRLVIKQGAKLTLIGIAVGLLGALALTKVMSGMLFGVSITDLTTFLGIPLLLAAVALLACYIPARRAARVDPMVALRYE